MRKRHLAKRRAAAAIWLWICSALVLSNMTAGKVRADDSPIVFDEYVGETTAASEPYSEPEYSENDAFEDESPDYSQETQTNTEEENNDGDDTYISNDGTVFRIPRVSDSSERVFDYRGILTEEEQDSLRARIAKLEERKKCDIIILIPENVPIDIRNGTETSQKYIRQFYIDNGFAEDGTGFMIDLDNRVLWTVGHGKYADTKFVSFTEEVYRDTLSAAKRGDFYAAASVYLDDFDAYQNLAKAMIPTPLSLLISAAAAIIGMLIFNAKHNSSQPSRAATPPLKVGNYRVLNHRENYLGTTVSRRRIIRHNDSGGGGGFSGGISSGGFSSGGGSFSGGGGHF